jgi:hypothetical protein
MKTFTLIEAAEFLKMCAEELRRRVRAGIIPGAKVGRAWVFIEDDLAQYLRSLYALPRQALRVTPGKEVTKCHYANVVRSGGSTSSLPMENEYAELLGLRIKP